MKINMSLYNYLCNYYICAKNDPSVSEMMAAKEWSDTYQDITNTANALKMIEVLWTVACIYLSPHNLLFMMSDKCKKIHGQMVERKLQLHFF